eukprot:gene32001-41500_t
MEECNGGIDPSSSHRSSSIISDGGAVSISQSNGLPPIPKVVDDDEEMQDGSAVSLSQSNGLSPIPKVVDDDEEMQDGRAVSSSQSNGLPPIREVVDDDEMQDGRAVSSSQSNGLSTISKVVDDEEKQDGRAVSSSKSNGLPPIPKVVGDEEMQDGSAVSSSQSNGLSPIPKGALLQRANADTPADISRIRQVSDRIASSEAVEPTNVQVIKASAVVSSNSLSACALSLFLYAIRTHAMTRHFFLDRPNLTSVDPLTALNQKVQNAILANVEANSAVDMSIVFIDFTAAVYKRIEHGLDKYAIRIVSRGRCRGEYFYLDYFADYDSLDFNKRLPGAFNHQHVHDEKPFPKPFTKGIFPAEITAGFAKGGKVKYFLEGVVMSLNEGQTTGYFGRNYPNPEMKILESTEWLTDEIISAAMLRFLEFNNYDVKSEGSPVIFSPEVITPMVETLMRIGYPLVYGNIKIFSAKTPGFSPLSIIRTIPTGFSSECILDRKSISSMILFTTQAVLQVWSELLRLILI